MRSKTTFSQEDGVVPCVEFRNHLRPGDTWQVTVHDKQTGEPRKVGKPILSHEAVERLARVFGVRVHRYQWLTTDTEDSMVMIEVTGFWKDGRITPEIGECLTANAGAVGKNYPRSMAWKRAYDRAVLKHLGIEAYSDAEAEEFGQGNHSLTGGEDNANGLAEVRRATKEQTTAIHKMVKLLQSRGKSVTTQSLIWQTLPGESSIDELTWDEARQVITAANRLLSTR